MNVTHFMIFSKKENIGFATNKKTHFSLISIQIPFFLYWFPFDPDCRIILKQKRSDTGQTSLENRKLMLTLSYNLDGWSDISSRNWKEFRKYDSVLFCFIVYYRNLRMSLFLLLQFLLQFFLLNIKLLF